MPVTAVVGAHWGDEGKGKVTDALAAEMDMVIRFNGGTNAGHTVVTPRGTFRLHLVPSGALHEGVTCLIGPGVVVNPDALIEELAMLESAGYGTGEIFVSARAHVVFPHHVALDAREEELRGAGKHGTTMQGIWPAYADKVARVGVRMGDLLHPGHLETSVRYQTSRTGRMLSERGGAASVDAGAVLESCRLWRKALGGRIVDGHRMVQEALGADRRILVEGHLGVMRDLDWGVYPFVTSSTCLPGGACAGAGIPAGRISRVVGVAKAYTTAVGAGPFPTELFGEAGDGIRERGHEFGTTTGRPRRCGWFDAPAARYAAEVAGFTELAVMKLDVLAGMESVRIATGYMLRGEPIDHMPHTAEMEEVEPVYETLPGWRLEAGISQRRDLPTEAVRFLDRLAELVGVPVSMVGLGPEREALVRIPI